MLAERGKAYVVGIDQTLVDIEAHVDLAFLERYGLSRGHSMLISDDVAEQIYNELKSNNMVVSEFAGGTIGNTMHNYSVLADSHSILLGVMSQDIRIGSYAYRYLCNTSSRVNLDYLQPVDGPVTAALPSSPKGRAQLRHQRRQDGPSGCGPHPRDHHQGVLRPGHHRLPGAW